MKEARRNRTNRKPQNRWTTKTSVRPLAANSAKSTGGETKTGVPDGQTHVTNGPGAEGDPIAGENSLEEEQEWARWDACLLFSWNKYIQEETGACRFLEEGAKGSGWCTFKKTSPAPPPPPKSAARGRWYRVGVHDLGKSAFKGQLREHMFSAPIHDYGNKNQKYIRGQVFVWNMPNVFEQKEIPAVGRALSKLLEFSTNSLWFREVNLCQAI